MSFPARPVPESLPFGWYVILRRLKLPLLSTTLAPVRHRTATVLLCLVSCTGVPSANATDGESSRPDALPDPLCLERLDAAVALAESGDTGRARLHLERLAPRCEHVPQIHHDLGVIAARGERLPAALAHFEKALESDPRVAMTLDHLRALNRREAALAYARALGQPGDAPRPALAFQDSGDVGADTLRARRITDDPARRVETLEHELHAWWRSAVDGDVEARLAHYVDGYPRREALAGRERDAALVWDDVSLEIAFTAEDAVAVIGHANPFPASDSRPDDGFDDDASGVPAGGGAQRRLLLLRPEGDRWRIYRESPL